MAGGRWAAVGNRGRDGVSPNGDRDGPLADEPNQGASGIGSRSVLSGVLLRTRRPVRPQPVAAAGPGSIARGNRAAHRPTSAPAGGSAPVRRPADRVGRPPMASRPRPGRHRHRHRLARHRRLRRPVRRHARADAPGRSVARLCNTGRGHGATASVRPPGRVWLRPSTTQRGSAAARSGWRSLAASPARAASLSARRCSCWAAWRAEP